MKIEITEKKVNPLQDRTEVKFKVDHTGGPTPTRKAITDELSKMLKAGKDTVILNNLDTTYGRGISKGYAKVYNSKESAIEMEREYLLKRNGLTKHPEKDKKAEGAPKAG
jgi:small subunit ribosomal protein S24e